MSTVVYDISSFTNGLNSPQFYEEVLAGILSPVVQAVNIKADDVSVIFNGDASGVISTLNALVSAHIPSFDPDIKLESSGSNDTTTILTSNQTANRTITLPDATTSLVGTDTVSSIDRELVAFNGTTGKIIQGVGVRHYGTSATDPTSPTPSAGDQYYNSAINHEMRYDGTRGKWLSVATLMDGCGVSGNTPSGQYYRRWNGMQMSATLGPFLQKGTIVRIGYTSATTATHTLEVRRNGTTIASLANNGQASASSNTIDSDFDEGTISCFNNGLSTVSNLQCAFYYKLRV